MAKLEAEVKSIPHNNVEKMLEFYMTLKDCFAVFYPSIEEFTQWIINNDVRCYILNLSDQIIGAATVRDTGEIHYLQNFCIVTPYRKMGFGKSFLNKIANYEEFIYWSTDEDTAPFYTKSGAVIYNRDKNVVWCSLCGDENTQK